MHVIRARAISVSLAHIIPDPEKSLKKIIFYYTGGGDALGGGPWDPLGVPEAHGALGPQRPRGPGSPRPQVLEAHRAQCSKTSR